MKNHRRTWQALALVVVLSTIPLAAVAETIGANCYRTVFNERDEGHDPANAYLLMLASYYAYGNTWNVGSFDEFSKAFQARFTEFGMTAFDFIDIRRKTGDTQVMIMSNERAVIVTFRGSESSNNGSFSPVKALYDWILTDFNFFKKSMPHWGSGIKVHRGFANALDIAYPRLKTIVNDHLAGGDKKLWITGHSLGAGIVPLAAFRLAFDGVPVHGVMSFAGPRVGNEAFVDAFRARLPNSQRWVNDHDLVTMLPFRWMNYEHTGPANNLYEDGKAVLNDADFTGRGKSASHLPGAYLPKMYNLLPPAIKAQVPPPPAFRLLTNSADAEVEKKFEAEYRGSFRLLRRLTGQ